MAFREMVPSHCILCRDELEERRIHDTISQTKNRTSFGELLARRAPSTIWIRLLLEACNRRSSCATWCIIYLWLCFSEVLMSEILAEELDRQNSRFASLSFRQPSHSTQRRLLRIGITLSDSVTPVAKESSMSLSSHGNIGDVPW